MIKRSTRTLQLELPYNPSLVLNALVTTIQHLKWRIKNRDTITDQMMVKTKITPFSWGSNITINIQVLDTEHTLLSITSTLRFEFEHIADSMALSIPFKNDGSVTSKWIKEINQGLGVTTHQKIDDFLNKWSSKHHDKKHRPFFDQILKTLLHELEMQAIQPKNSMPYHSKAE